MAKKSVKRSQVRSEIFQKLFKPRSIPRWVIIAAPLLTALIVALICQYVVVLPVKGSSAVPWLILAGLIIGTPLAYKFREKKFRGITLCVAIVIGFFLVPYFAFFLGKIHLFVVDQMNMPGAKVIEMRITQNRIAWVKTDGTEVIAWPGPITITLHPGVTRIYVGTMNIPAGSYTGRAIYIDTVEIDTQVDLSVWTTPEGGPIPPEYYQEVYDNFRSEFDSHFQQEFPQGSSSNWALNGSIITFTMSTGPFQVQEPEQLDYPGFGGPDITLDFTLSEQGMVTVTPILDFPPGFSSPTGQTGGPPS